MVWNYFTETANFTLNVFSFNYVNKVNEINFQIYNNFNYELCENNFYNVYIEGYINVKCTLYTYVCKHT